MCTVCPLLTNVNLLINKLYLHILEKEKLSFIQEKHLFCQAAAGNDSDQIIICTKDRFLLDPTATSDSKCTVQAFAETDKQQESKTLKQLMSLQRTTVVKKQMRSPWMYSWCRDEDDAWARGAPDHANLPHSHHLRLCSVLRRVLLPHERKHTVTVCEGPVSVWLNYRTFVIK